jgi:hypothetical protein
MWYLGTVFFNTLQALVVVACLAGGQGTRITLTASPSVVEPGQPAILSWNSSSGAFISGVGRVGAAGSLAVRPTQPTRYVIMTIEDGRLESATAVIDVVGVRGGEVLGPRDFGDPQERGFLPKASFVGFAGYVDKTLRDLKFDVRPEHLPGTEHCTLFTSYLRQPLRSSDRNVRQRQLAYAVRIYHEADGVRYEISAIVQHVLLGERDSKRETDNDLIKSFTRDLDGRLVSFR